MFYVDLETTLIDRFDLAKFLDFTNDGVFDPLNSYLLYQIPRLTAIGTYTIRKEAKRPDLLAYNIYGDTQYWWVLMWYNSLYSVDDLRVGLNINYPGINDIEELYLNATLLQKVTKS